MPKKRYEYEDEKLEESKPGDPADFADTDFLRGPEILPPAVDCPWEGHYIFYDKNDHAPTWYHMVNGKLITISCVDLPSDRIVHYPTPAEFALLVCA